MKQTLLKTLIAAAVITISVSSCKKENESPAPELSANHAAKAVVPGVVNTAAFTSVWGNPYNPASYGTVAYDLVANALGTPGEALFSGQVNNTIAAGAGFTLHYLYNTSFTLASITAADLIPANNYTAVSSIGMNTSTGAVPNGWFNYASPSPVPVAGFFVVVEDGVDFYVLQLTGFPNAASRPAATDQNGDGVINGRDIEVKSDVNFSYKLL
jgi:hypothetical protein